MFSFQLLKPTVDIEIQDQPSEDDIDIVRVKRQSGL